MKINLLFIASLFIFASCKNISKPITSNSNESHHHDHDHDHHQNTSNIPEHKLIFPSKIPDRIIVNLTDEKHRGFAVNWRTNQEITSGYVEFAEETHGTEFLLDNRVTQIKATTEFITVENKFNKEPKVNASYHSVIIKNLKPETTYVYRVGDGKNESNWSEWFQIKTPSDDINTAFSFIYFGDAQNDVKSMWSRVIRKSFSMIPDVNFMLHAGDLINNSESDKEWGEWFYAGSFIHATVPSIMTPGNHEYNKAVNRATLSALWRPQFTLPENAPLDELKETCFSVDYLNMKLISIDAQSLINSQKSRDAQVKWLDSILASNTKKWTTLTLHYPIHSTAMGRDNTELREAIKPLIDKYNIDLVLQGHDHTYARGYASNEGLGKMVVEDAGTIYAVSVSGPKMYDSQDQDWMVKRGEFTQLFQIITVKNDTLKYNAYTPLGRSYDSFHLVKNKDGKKTIINNAETKKFTRFKKDFIKE